PCWLKPGSRRVSGRCDSRSIGPVGVVAPMAVAKRVGRFVMYLSAGVSTGHAASYPAKAIISHVQCAVCKMAMKEVRNHVKETQIDDEDSLTDYIEYMCLPKKNEGKWLLKLDISRDKPDAQLSIVKQDKVGKCNEECRMLQVACYTAIDGKEESIVSMLRESAGLAKMQNKICDKPCSAKSIKQLEEWKDEKFEEDKDAEINSLLDSMKGMPGMENMKMYKPGDLEKEMKDMKEEL
ncbi:unnamed protein product, partial [Prorocentrum cordatum]